MPTKNFADRFSNAEVSWMNEELTMWVPRQMLDIDMEILIATSRARSFVCEELLGKLHPAPIVAR